MLPQFCPVRGHSGPVLTLTEGERRAFYTVHANGGLVLGTEFESVLQE